MNYIDDIIKRSNLHGITSFLLGGNVSINKPEELGQKIHYNYFSI